MKLENERKILKTARILIASRGDSVSVREIATSSGLSHAGLRKKWRTRHELLAAVHQSINKDLSDALGPEPENEALPVFLVKALFALKSVQDAAGYYSYQMMPSFPNFGQESNPLMDRLTASCKRYLESHPGLASKYGPMFSDPTVLSAALFSLLLAFSPARLSRVCEAFGTAPGVEEQFPILFLNSLTAFLSVQ